MPNRTSRVSLCEIGGGCGSAAHGNSMTSDSGSFTRSAGGHCLPVSSDGGAAALVSYCRRGGRRSHADAHGSIRLIRPFASRGCIHGTAGLSARCRPRRSSVL